MSDGTQHGSREFHILEIKNFTLLEVQLKVPGVQECYQQLFCRTGMLSENPLKRKKVRESVILQG